MIRPVRDLCGYSNQDPIFVALDTNILIQLCDESHQWYQSTIRVFDTIKREGVVKPIYFLATKLELLEYFRRKYFLDFLKANVDSGLFGGTGQADEVLANMIIQKGDDDYLSDRDVKHLRNSCVESYDTIEAGLKTWENVSRLALGAKLPKLETDVVKMGIEYKGLYDKDLFPEGAQPPKWENQTKLMARYVLSSADAAILNMAASSEKIHGIVTNDADMLEIFKRVNPKVDIECYTFVNKHVG